MSALTNLSLRAQLGVVGAAFMAVVIGIAQLILPPRLDQQAQEWAERRAADVTTVLASAMAPQLEDTRGLKALLNGLSSTPDILYARVQNAGGLLLAAWHGELAPDLGAKVDTEPRTYLIDGRLHVLAPIHTAAGERGSLQVGFSLDQLERQKAQQHRTVSWLALVTLVTGVGLSLLVGTVLARPIRELTRVAGHIAAEGDLRHEITVRSGGEVAVLAGSFRQMVKRLRTIPDSLGGTVEGIAQVADQLSQTVQALSNGSAIVGVRVTETSTSAQQMLAVLRGISDNVEDLDRNAEASATSNAQMVAVNNGVAKQVADMADAASETTTSVEQLTSWIRQISGHIEELNSSIESTSASMSEMDAAIGDVEDNANETTKLSAEAAESAREGAQAIKKTIAGIDRIRESSTVVSKLIESLGDRLSHIGDIIVVIDTVAGQTNLLALNAAIIAAQAGEHGRGFAVVADEIKALATRTAASTQEIRNLIEGIQEESAKAVTAVDETARSIAEGVKLGGAAEQALGQITEATARATEMVRAIATSTVGQARASREVTTAIHRIAESIQRIHGAAREQARSSERITEIVGHMHTMTQSVLRSSEEQRKGANLIAESVENISSMVKTIAEAQREQTDGAEHVLKAVEAIKEVAMNQTGAVTGLESALEILRRHSSSLNSAVRQFRA